MGRPKIPVPEGSRWCGKCKTALPLEKFTNNERSCTECKKWYHLQWKYGLTKDDFELLYEAQNGKCKLCGDRDIQYVDHDHQTGEVRGLVCARCNTGIGAFRDSPELFRKALNYLGYWVEITRIARNE